MARKRHTEQCLSTPELLTFGQQDWVGGAIEHMNNVFASPLGMLKQRLPAREGQHQVKMARPLYRPLAWSFVGVSQKECKLGYRQVNVNLTTPQEDYGLW